MMLRTLSKLETSALETTCRRYGRRKVLISLRKTAFTVGDIGQKMNGFEVLNPELVICRMDESTFYDGIDHQ